MKSLSVQLRKSESAPWKAVCDWTTGPFATKRKNRSKLLAGKVCVITGVEVFADGYMAQV
jgi:hypothetical protein